MYSLLQFVHVVAAIVWIGAGTLVFVLVSRLSAAGDDEGVARLGRQGAWVSRAVYTPAAVLLLLAGIGMGLVADSFDWGAPWVSVGFLGIVVSLGIEHGAIGPTAKKLDATATSEGAASSPARSLARRIGLLSAVDLVVLYVAVFAMVTQFSF